MKITTKYGDECEVLRPAARREPSALVRRLSDGAEFLLYYEDLGRDRGEMQKNKNAFYHREHASTGNIRATARLKELAVLARELATSTQRVRDMRSDQYEEIEAQHAADWTNYHTVRKP